MDPTSAVPPPAAHTRSDADDDTGAAPRHTAMWLLAGVAVALVLGDLGGLDLWAPDEPRYAQVAEEVRRMDGGPSDLVLLHLGGEPYTQKPPLYFWLAAATGSVTSWVGDSDTHSGVDEWAARLPSALAGLATLAIWIAIGRRLRPATPVGWITGALLLTSFRFLHFARRAQLDVLLALFESLALWAFLDWIDAATPRRRRRALWVLHPATALALLTKGPVALLPWLCFAAALAYAGRAREIRQLFPIWGVAVACGPVLVWIAACIALAPPGFFEAAVVENLWTRFSEGADHARPFWYFVVQLPVEALPWSLAWPVVGYWAWRTRVRPNAGSQAAALDRVTTGVLVAWVVVPLAFFSLSAGKRGVYVLPVVPAACLWLAFGIERLRQATRPGRGLDGPAAVLVPCALVGIVAALPWPVASWDALSWPSLLPSASGLGAGAMPAELSPSIRAAIASTRMGLLLVASGGAALTLLTFLPRASAARVLLPRIAPGRMRGGVLAWAVLVGLWGVWTFALLPALDPEKSPRPVAVALSRASSSGEPVGLFAQGTLLGGVLFYGDYGNQSGGNQSDGARSGGGQQADRPVRLLEDAESVAAFVAEGGRVVAVKERHVEALEAIGPIRMIERLRSGSRVQWIVEVGPNVSGPVRSDALR